MPAWLAASRVGARVRIAQQTAWAPAAPLFHRAERMHSLRRARTGRSALARPVSERCSMDRRVSLQTCRINRALEWKATFADRYMLRRASRNGKPSATERLEGILHPTSYGYLHPHGTRPC